MKKSKLMAVILMLCVITVIGIPVESAQAANKSSVSYTFTVKKSSYQSLILKTIPKKKVKLKVSAKILSISGKPKANEEITYLYFENNNGKGSLFYCFEGEGNCTHKQFKKNATLKSNVLNTECPPEGKGNTLIEYGDLPEGVKKIKVKLTVTTVDGKKDIISFKKGSMDYSEI